MWWCGLIVLFCRDAFCPSFCLLNWPIAIHRLYYCSLIQFHFMFYLPNHSLQFINSYVLILSSGSFALPIASSLILRDIYFFTVNFYNSALYLKKRINDININLTMLSDDYQSIQNRFNATAIAVHSAESLLNEKYWAPMHENILLFSVVISDITVGCLTFHTGVPNLICEPTFCFVSHHFSKFGLWHLFWCWIVNTQLYPFLRYNF